MFDMTKQLWGCPESRIKRHNYQWSLGPDVPVKVENGLIVQESFFGGPGDWWMYCVKCGRKVWEDE